MFSNVTVAVQNTTQDRGFLECGVFLWGNGMLFDKVYLAFDPRYPLGLHLVSKVHA